MGYNQVPAPSGRFVARIPAPGTVSIAVSTARCNCCLRRHVIRFVSCCIFRTARPPKRPRLLLQMPPSLPLPQRALHRELTPLRSLIRCPRLPWRCCPPKAFPPGRVDEQPQLQAQTDNCGKLWLRARRGPSSTCSAIQHPTPSPPAATASARRFGPCSFPLACPDGTYFVRLRPRRACENPSIETSFPPGTPLVTTADFHALGACSKPRFGYSAARMSPADWEREKTTRAHAPSRHAIHHSRPTAGPAQRSLYRVHPRTSTLPSPGGSGPCC